MSSRIEPNRFELGFSAVRNARQISVAGSPVQSTLLKVARAVAIVAAAAFDLLRNLTYAVPRAFVLGVNRFFPLAVEKNQTEEAVAPLAITDRPATPVAEEVVAPLNATSGALILYTPTQDSEVVAQEETVVAQPATPVAEEVIDDPIADIAALFVKPDDESEFNPDTAKVLDIHKPRGFVGNLTRGMASSEDLHAAIVNIFGRARTYLASTVLPITAVVFPGALVLSRCAI